MITPFHIVIESDFQQIREKDEPQHKKQDGQFYQDQLPQCFAQGHGAEAVNIKKEDTFKRIQAVNGLCRNKNLNYSMRFYFTNWVSN